MIEDHWEEMLRIAVLLEGGHVTASLLISRLQSRTDTGLGRALQAYGRLCKTEHLLRYLAGEEYRRRIGRQLNRGEALHALRRFLVFGNLARLHPKDSDALSNQALLPQEVRDPDLGDIANRRFHPLPARRHLLGALTPAQEPLMRSG